MTQSRTRTKTKKAKPQSVKLDGRSWEINRDILQNYLQAGMHQSKLVMSIVGVGNLMRDRPHVVLCQFYMGVLLVKNPAHPHGVRWALDNPLQSVIMEAKAAGVPMVLVDDTRIRVVHKQQAKLVSITKGLK